MRRSATHINNVWSMVMTDLKLNGHLHRNTIELIGDQLIIDMQYPILHHPARTRMSPNFMFAEAAWILSGRNDLLGISFYAPSISRFSDDGRFLAGAYGPKIVDQLPYILECLTHDPDSRQAVINIWRERPHPSKDIPCTTSVQFLLRGQYLHTVVTMRSSDVWLGLPYDVFTFSMLSAYVLLMLRSRLKRDIMLGYMVHNAGSRHLYLSNNPSEPTIGPAEYISNLKITLPSDTCDAQEFLDLLQERATMGIITSVPQHYRWMNYGSSPTSKELGSKQS